MKTVFVTGAEGFAGRHLVNQLVKQGVEVVGGVRNRARKLAFEKQYGKALVCDVSDAINVARCVASVKPDGVIHLASTSQQQVAADEPLSAYQSIVTAWANVLDAVRRSVPRSRVLLVGSCDVYGNGGSSGQPISENTPCAPTGTFGSLKAAAESIAQAFYRNYHLNISIARPFYYTGPGQSESWFLPTIARRIWQWNNSTDGDTLRVPDLGCRRDLLHVSDVVDAFWKLLCEGKPNETYNVCSGNAQTVGQFCEWLAQRCGKSIRFESFQTEGDGYIDCLCGDNSKLCNTGGWRVTRSAQDALSDLVGSLTQTPAPIGA